MVTTETKSPFEDGPEQRSPIHQGRAELYRKLFGDFPRQLTSCRDLGVAWPGGGLVEFEAPTLARFRVTATFGLTNDHLPTTAPGRAPDLQRPDVSGMLNVTFGVHVDGTSPPRDRYRAGFGYELLMISGAGFRGETSPEAHLLSQLVRMQLSHPERNLLDRLEVGAGVTHHVGAGRNERSYLVAPIWDLIPADHRLPNGEMRFLCVVELNSAEIALQKAEGSHGLVEWFWKQSVLPISGVTRRSYPAR